MPGHKQIYNNKLATLAALMGAAMTGYEDKFFRHEDTQADQSRLNNAVREMDERSEKARQTLTRAVPEQLHDFNVKGITFKAKSRQDAIKQAVRQGILPNKKKKRKKSTR